MVASTSTNSFLELSKHMDELTRKFEMLCSNHFLRHGGSHSRGCSSSQYFRSSRNHRCWYHRRFSEKAVKCIEPCSYSKSSENE